MSYPFDLSALHRALAAAPGLPTPDPDRLQPIAPRGLDNDHVLIAATTLIVRIPRWPLPGLSADRALALRAARFRRAGPSGHAPGLKAILAPVEGLPHGALVVDRIEGRPAGVPDDLAAVAAALAALHGLALPGPDDRRPLPDMDDPAAALIGLVEAQLPALTAAGVAGGVVRRIQAELDQGRRIVAGLADCPQPVALVGTDTHPGNFLVDAGSRAFLVDLDKAMYGSPAVDLAHASLATSVFWATGGWDRLTPAARTDFYRRYLDAVPQALAGRLAPWLAPMARLTWLRTTSWAAVWRAERLDGLRSHRALAALVAEADRRTAAILDEHNVERQAGMLPAWDGDVSA